MRIAFPHALTLLWLVAPAFAWGQGQGQPTPTTKPGGDKPHAASPKHERISGVIVKAEDLNKGRTKPSAPGSSAPGPRGKLVTINTAAVWQDWVRDQATPTGNQSPRAAAEKGARSVATQGEPKSPDTLVTIEVAHDAKIVTRFRAPADETSEGARTPAGASETEKDQAAGHEAAASPKGPRFDLATLKPGLYVEVEFRTEHQRNRADRVAVIRPVGGSGTTPPEAIKSPQKEPKR